MTLTKEAAAYYWRLCKVHGVEAVAAFLARVMQQAYREREGKQQP